jgi:tetratricopeptide (TPR) repeat protein
MLEDQGSPLAHRVRGAHARALLDLLRECAPGTAPARATLDVELDNLRTALDWAITHAPGLLDAEHVGALLRYLTSRGRPAEARRRMTAIATAAGVDDAVRAAAWHGAGVAANEQQDHDEALACAERAATGFDQLQDPASAAAARTLAGTAHRDLGRLPQARAAWEAALAGAQRAEDGARVAILWNNLGLLEQDVGDLDTAQQYLHRSRRARQRRGDGRGVAVSDVNLGILELDRGDWRAALDHLERAVVAWRRLDEPSCVALALARAAEAQLGIGAQAAARRSATQAHALATEVGHRGAAALAASRLGDLAVLDGDPADAARRYTQALQGCQAATERLRATERLALALALTGTPDAVRRARRLLSEAARTRRERGFCAPAPQQEWIDRAQDLVTSTVSAAAGPAAAPGGAGSGPLRSAAC